MSKRATITWFIVMAILGVVLFTQAAKKMEERQGPRVLPLSIESFESITIEVYDPNVLEKIRDSEEVFLEENFLDGIEVIVNDSF